MPWSRKTHDQRAEYMGLYFYPRMKAVFQEHDAKAYAEFRCQTCHGEDMEKVGFVMPNSLYALPAADPLKAALGYDERTAKFMAEKVEPAMKELLGNDSLGCLNCHPTER